MAEKTYYIDMKTFSIKEAFHNSWELFKVHKKVLIISTLILIAANIAGDSMRDNWSIWSGILNLVFYVIGLWIMVGLLKIVISIFDGGAPKVEELFAHNDLIWKYFLVTVCYGLIVFLGLVLLIVPGVYLLVKYIFAPLLVVDKGLSVSEAFKESARMTEGVKWKILKLALVCILLIILGFIALGVGLLVSIPVVQLMYVSVYRRLSSIETAQV